MTTHTLTHQELVRERRASEARRRKREAAEAKHVPPHAGHMGRIVRWDRTEDFLPPDDLIHPKRVA